MRPAVSLALRAAVALFVGTALAACSSSDEVPQVASVPTADSSDARAGSASGGSPAAGADAADSADRDRPILRIDDSPERVAALWNAHSTCLLQHGARKPGDDEIVAAPGAVRGESGDGNPGVLVHRPVPAKAEAACIHLEPEGPLELEAATNPDFHEQSLAYVDCLRRHGEYVRLLNDHNLDWTYEAGHAVPEDNGRIEQDCLIEAFGGH